jgi:hypothetical protein
MAIYSIEIEESGTVFVGQPAGTLVSGISIPDNCTYRFEFMVIVRNSNMESWGCQYHAMWERDIAGGVPLKVAGDVVDVWTCPGSYDWGFVVEVDVNNDLQIRAYGTVGAYDTRWNVTGILTPCFPPIV